MSLLVGVSAFPFPSVPFSKNGNAFHIVFFRFFKHIRLFKHVCLAFYIKALCVPRSEECERYPSSQEGERERISYSSLPETGNTKRYSHLLKMSISYLFHLLKVLIKFSDFWLVVSAFCVPLSQRTGTHCILCFLEFWNISSCLYVFVFHIMLA